MSKNRHNYGMSLRGWAVFSGLVIAISYLFFSLDLTHAQVARNNLPSFEAHKTALAIEENEPVGRTIGSSRYFASVDGLAHIPSNHSVGISGSKPNNNPTVSSSSTVSVAFNSASYRVNEGEPVQVTVRLSTGASEALSIPVTIGRGTAETGDYRVSGLSGGSLSYSKGSTSASFIIVALQDNDTDDETLNLAFGTLPGDVASGSIPTATLTISDDDRASITLSYNAASYLVNEGEPLQVTARLSTAAPQPLRIPVTITRGTAETTDYQISGLSNESISFSQGSQSASFIVLAIGDNDTADETLFLAFGTLPSSVALGTNPVAKITINDDDSSRIGLSYSAASYQVNEGDPVQVTAQLSSATSQALRVPVTIRRGSAEAGDYRVTGLSNGALTFSQGSRSASFIVVALQDNDADDEVLTLAFGNLPGGVVNGAIPSATLAISDDERANIGLSFGSINYQVDEGEPVQVTATLSTAASHSLRVPVTIGRGTAEAGDYWVSGLSGGYLNFIQGSRTASFLIVALQDNDVDDEVLDLGFGTLPGGLTAGSVSGAALIISDDEVPPPLQLNVYYGSARYAVPEGHAVTVTVQLSANSDRELLVPITVSNQSAEDGDYHLSGLINGSLYFPPGDRSESFALSARQDDDTDDEQVRVGFGALPADTVLGLQSAAYVTIGDDDTAPVPVETVNVPPAFTEGESTTRGVEEQASVGTPIGLPITAADPDGDPLTYHLDGVDASYFSIESRTGQLRVGGSLDLELKPTYLLTVLVSDGRGETDSLEVSVSLSDILEVPLTAPSSQAVGLTTPGTPLSVETPDGVTAIQLPPDFHESPLFVLIESAAVDCGGQWPDGEVLTYSTVRFFDTWGTPVHNVNMAEALVSLRWDALATGDFAAGYTYDRDDRIEVYRHQEGSWTPSDYSFVMEGLGVGRFTVSGIAKPTCLLALVRVASPAQTILVPPPTPETDVEEAVASPADRERPTRQPTNTPEPALVEQDNGASPSSLSTSGPIAIQAGMGSEFPWWPRPFIVLGALLLLAALAWQLAQVVKERRLLGKSFSRPQKTTARDVTSL